MIVVSGPIIVSGKNQNNVPVATFTHTSGVEPAIAFSASINLGDGSSSAGSVTLFGTTYSVIGSHRYSGSGSHTITTTVTEPTGSGGTPSPGPRIGPGNIATTPGRLGRCQQRRLRFAERSRRRLGEHRRIRWLECPIDE